MKEVPSKHFLENLPEKASIHAFIHLKLIGNLQGFSQYNYNGRHAKSKYRNGATSGEKIRGRFERKILLNDYDFCGKMPPGLAKIFFSDIQSVTLITIHLDIYVKEERESCG